MRSIVWKQNLQLVLKTWVEPFLKLNLDTDFCLDLNHFQCELIKFLDYLRVSKIYRGQENKRYKDINIWIVETPG